MSLKAKIEAVIYASEEPVTLTQLVGLLGQEAQAELDREREAQQALALELAEAQAEAAAATAAATGEEALDAVAPAENAAENAETASIETAATEAAEPAAETATEEPVTEETSETDGKKKKLTDAEKAAAKQLREYFRRILAELIADYANNDRGLEIKEVANGFRFATKPEYHDAVRGFVKSLKPALKLSLPALETLAVIAYKQPVTAPEISEVRGVDSGGVLGSLIARKLITTAGRKQVIGRPILYKTTKDFLLRFGLKDISELPSIEEFEKMAGELAEQEEIPMGEPGTEETGTEANGTEASETETNEDALRSDHELLQEENAVEPQADGSGDPAGNVADETIVDGRISGLPPNYEREDANDPSAVEAEEQERNNEGVE